MAPGGTQKGNIYISFKVVIEQKRLSQIKSTLELTALNYNDWFTA
jgi:hypothetical protein